ncbi:MAG: hypothetical protein COX77_01885 [Candidatus Komeilibacteria bacterium CG_4_10_14_0_2_um_filter_37_10]|uniref:Uncharacterized protein n=1 Tax=Candidatus Komeilibacteria bacterium CG_4_10_14_0_2_um_filter_37_10 TaxID=1974470 RepID=A0A2M7VFV5_9BACT|nr:MAG: hypothetical protein COX77_01885 [Candidatus Komeilibacteria bacterium CG_4_10_14_0_2_um_filter_37_10]
MTQLLKNKVDSHLLKKAWDLDQQALFLADKKRKNKLWVNSLLICRRLLRKYIEKSPENLQILSKIYLIYLHQAKFILAKKYLDLANKKQNNDSIILFNYGNYYRALNKSRLAINYYKKAIKLSNEKIFKDELKRYLKILKSK